jgi:hypothetical protein
MWTFQVPCEETMGIFVVDRGNGTYGRKTTVQSVHRYHFKYSMFRNEKTSKFPAEVTLIQAL